MQSITHNQWAREYLEGIWRWRRLDAIATRRAILGIPRQDSGGSRAEEPPLAATFGGFLEGPWGAAEALTEALKWLWGIRRELAGSKEVRGDRDFERMCDLLDRPVFRAGGRKVRDLEQWEERMVPWDLVERVQGVVAGGFVRDLLAGESPKDCDIFTTLEKAPEGLQMTLTSENPQRSTYTEDVGGKGTPSQIIVIKEGSVGAWIRKFDSEANQYWIQDRQIWTLDGEECWRNRFFPYNFAHHAGPLAWLGRALRMQRRGWQIPEVDARIALWQASLSIPGSEIELVGEMES